MGDSTPKIPEGAQCHYCSEPATTWDHVVPYRWGGRNRTFNRVLACYDCNHAKGCSMPTCACDFCRIAVAEWKAQREMDVGEVYYFGEVETKPGLPIETVEQLQAFLDRMGEEEAR